MKQTKRPLRYLLVYRNYALEDFLPYNAKDSKKTSKLCNTVIYIDTYQYTKYILMIPTKKIVF